MWADLRETFRRVNASLKTERWEFFLHAGNYLSADVISRGLLFISIPIFTRILSPDEYGLLSIFLSLLPILMIFMDGGIKSALVRVYYDGNYAFDNYLGSNLQYLAILNTGLVLLFMSLRKVFSAFFNIPESLFILAIFVTLFSIPIQNIYLSYLQASRRSRDYLLVSLGYYGAIFIGSLSLFLYLSENRYYGEPYARMIVSVAFTIFVFARLASRMKLRPDLASIKYTILFGLPLVPHALSAYILGYFDRIIINQVLGAGPTGFYSFAYNIGLIMHVVVMAFNKSWVPIFYKEIESGNYTRIQALANDYAKLIYIITFGLIVFSRELALILGVGSYLQAIPVIPVIVISYTTVFLYTLYANYSFFRKKTFLISAVTLVSGGINLVLNYVFIPRYGIIAAAFTTYFSYLVLFIFNFIVAKYILGEKQLVSLRNTIPFYLINVLLALSIGFFNPGYNIILGIVLKIALLLVFVYAMFFRYINARIRNRH